MPGNPAGLLTGNTPAQRDDDLYRDGYKPGQFTGPLRLNISGDLCGITFSEPGPGVWSSRGKSTAPVYKPSPFAGRFRRGTLSENNRGG